MKRKSPVRHKVRQHTRKNRSVREYARGKGNKQVVFRQVRRVLTNSQKEKLFYDMIRTGKVKIYQGTIKGFDKGIVPLLYDLNIAGYVTVESALAHTKDRPLEQYPIIFFRKSYPELFQIAKEKMKQKLPIGFKVTVGDNFIEIRPPDYNITQQRNKFYAMIKEQTDAKPGTTQYIKDVGELGKRIMKKPEKHGFVSVENRRIANNAFINGIRQAIEEVQ